MNLWEWITTTTSPDSWITTLGIGTLALLFATDRILTRGQHSRRVADLTEHHAREIKEKDARLADARESREGYKEAARVERERADRATASVGEIADTLTGVLHVLQSLDRVLPAPSPEVETRHDRA